MVAPVFAKALNFGASLIGALAGDLVKGFAPLAHEKIAERLGRHSSPAVAEQVATAMIDTVMAATGKSDPVAAVAAAKASPAVVQQAEDSALATLDRLAPLFDKLAQSDRQAWDAEESSRDAASRRAAAEPWDMTQALVYGAFAMIGVLILFVCGIATAQAWKGDIKPEVWAQVAGLIGFATGVGVTIYAFRFGSSRGNSVKDLVIGELARRPKGQ